MENNHAQKKETKRQIMIILWKWKDLIDSKKKEAITFIKHTKERLIHRVHGKANKETIQFLQKLLTETYKDDHVFLFVHRNPPHHFTQNHVEELLQELPASFKSSQFKCFLIGGGKAGGDFIYFSTKFEGLLNEHGGFMNGKIRRYEEQADGTTKRRVKTISVVEYNEKKQREEVKPEHFNRVWRHYADEFEKKIYALQVDLLSRLIQTPIQNGENSSPKNSTHWMPLIKSEEVEDILWVRLKSFLGHYDTDVLVQLKQDERKERRAELVPLKKEQEKHQTTYVFDDCTINLEENSIEAKEKYEKIRVKLTPIFIEQDGITSISLTDIDDLFTELVATFNND